MFIKAAPHGQLVKGLVYFFETSMDTDGSAFADDNLFTDDRERKLIKFGVKVVKTTLSSSTGLFG